MNTRLFFFLFFAVYLLSGTTSQAADVLNSDWDDVVDGNCDGQSTAWWSSAEAIRIAENVLLYQKDIGGWPKNIDMHLILTQTQKDALIASKSDNSDCTIDNGAVWLELTYLSKVYAAIADSAVKAQIKAGFLKGVQYLLDAQYDNGGWPQYYPLRGGYSNHITYNDNAMTHAMEILMHIYLKDGAYSIVAPDSMVADAEVAFDKGIECVFNTQYIQQGLLTSWCAQHHYSTLEPVMARSYELASLSGSEAGKLARFLMSINNPSYEIRRAIYHVVNWYDDVRIQGYRVEEYVNADGLDDLRVVADPNAPNMWARFYTLEDNIPFFCSRDGIMRYSLAEISYERRNNYRWYVDEGYDVFSAYNSWYPKWGLNTEQETIIQSPVSDAVHLTNDPLPVKANANEYKFGCIKKFELYLDDVFISDYGTEKIDTLLTGLAAGPHTIIVKSTDDIGYSTSDTSSFVVVPGYSLTVNSGSGGGNYAEGAEVSIKADTPPNGQVFEKWTGDTIYVADVDDASTTVTMPAGDLLLTAVYKEVPSAIYDNATEVKQPRCYPNPANSSFSIDLSETGNSTVEIYNLFGQCVYNAESDASVHVIDDHDLAPGMYIILITDRNKNIYSQKLMIE